MRWSGVAVSAVVLLSACGGSRPARHETMSPEETARRYPEMSVTISKQEPPPGCQAMGAVSAGGWSVDDAYEGLQKQAAKRHANYVVLDGIANGVFGRAFRCAEAPTQPAAAVTTSATTCEPECSPGYACVRGTCVSACNPPCEKGQRCGTDRACHLVQ